MHYRLVINDIDIGSQIYERATEDYDDLVKFFTKTVQSASIEDPDNEENEEYILQKYLFENHLNQIIDEFEHFDFFSGMREYVFWFPGKHRQIIVRQLHN